MGDGRNRWSGSLTTMSIDPAPVAAVDPDQPIRRVAFLFALTAEGMGFAEQLGLEDRGRLDPRLPAHWWSGRVGSLPLEIAVAFAGRDPDHGVDRIGTVAAALAGYKLCRAFEPDLLVNAGTCGGFQARGGEVGSIYVADGGILFHDHHIQIPGWDAFGVGRIPAGPTNEVVEALGAVRGVVSTGDSFTPTPQELAFFEREQVAAKEMEAAAIARLARDLGIPFLAVKAVTDLVDAPEPEHEAFERNLARVSSLLQVRLSRFVDWLAEGRLPREVVVGGPEAGASAVDDEG